MQKLSQPKFVAGLKLSRLFYIHEVKLILRREYPGLRHSAALIGWGSEVLGFDTQQSCDHHWGPRVLLFLSEEDHPKLNHEISDALAQHLPYEFMGYSTNYSKPELNGVRHPLRISSGPVDHMINIYTTRQLFKARLGFDPATDISVADWLTFPQQRLLELTSGAVYYDGLRELERLRKKFGYYPKDIWLYMLSAQWTRISQEEAFVGRTGDVGDELGSQIIAARLVREIMKLGFLMERQYAPYSKWLGSAFKKLRIAKSLTPLLEQVLKAKTWRSREKWLAEAYSLVARQHNALKITKRLSTDTSGYYTRPYRVINADRFAREIRGAIHDPKVDGIKINIGAIDQFTDSTDVIEDSNLIKKLRVVYD